jgi:ABC-2 type transport system permease protein
MSEAQGEVFDLGYQHYEGPREGRMRARKAIWINGVRTALGIGRGWGSKTLPALLFMAVMIPAVVISIVAATVGPIGDFPGHDGYYQIISTFLVIFSAIIAPELLCPDRRDGVISLYLVRPLTTTDYVASRWLAFLSVTLALVYLGQVVLFLGFVLAADEPADYIRDNWLDVPRFLLAGLVVAVFTTTIPLAVSAFTTRRAYAAAFVIGVFFISLPVSAILTLCEDDGGEQRSGAHVEMEQSEDFAREPEPCRPATGDAAKWFALINLGGVPIHVNDLIFPEENTSEFAKLVAELPNVVPLAWYLLLTAGPGFLLWWRYKRISI